MRFDIDLEFSTTLPAEEGAEAAVVNGRIEAAGKEIHINTDSPALFRLGSRKTLPAIREFADSLARRGITVTVSVPEGTIVSLGAVETSVLQRVLTNSPHIKLGKSNIWATVIKSQVAGGSRPGLVPPPTLFPLSPTFQRRYRMKPTTTHYARGGGRPRLIFVRDSDTWNGLPPYEYNLTEENTLIGSGSEAHFKLPELAEVQGSIVHTDDDEYVFVPHGAGSIKDKERILRTGARILLGPWRIVYFREEYADHGRPFGGREAGEFSRLQRPQLDPRVGQIEYDAVAGLGDPRKNQ